MRVALEHPQPEVDEALGAALLGRVENVRDVADPKVDTNEKRRANHDELYAICQEIFLGYDAEPLIQMLVTKGLPAARD